MVRRHKARRRINPAWFFLAPVIIVVVAIVIFPMMYSAYVSLTDLTLTSPTTKFVGAQNYLKILSDPDFRYSLGVTGIYVLTTLSVELVLGMGLAFLMIRQFRGMRIVRTLMVAPMMMLPASVGLTWDFIYRPDIGVVNYFLRMAGLHQVDFLSSPAIALWSVASIDIWEWSPFVGLILAAGLQTLPSSVAEAAEVDGASAYQKFRFIILPWLWPVIFVTILLRFIDSMRLVDIIYVTTNGGPGLATSTLPYLAFNIGFFQQRFGYAAAVSWILVALLSVIITILVRRIRAS